MAIEATEVVLTALILDSPPTISFDCPAKFLGKLFKIHLDSAHQLLCSTEVIDVAKAVLDTLEQIYPIALLDKTKITTTLKV
ncbi:hypothetical protein HNY73_017136 [Argiope bruennichi]|uniref:Uncharacterized protein n=1 Tax=Argiope bruennichi TaxID=94029 RepID=A0A8T0EME9_ARGBR|nr:hypothetical protein HNY73_017136 [Argiope bruennichi]